MTSEGGGGTRPLGGARAAPAAAPAAGSVAPPVARCVAGALAALVEERGPTVATELIVDCGEWFSAVDSEGGMAGLRHQRVKLSGAKRGSWRDFSRCKTLRSSVARTGACTRKL